MPLLFSSLGEQVSINSLAGDAAVKQHLRELGFVEGDSVTVVSRTPSGLIVKVKDSRIALDKAMASKIMV